mgnify:CR=1 FL=1
MAADLILIASPTHHEGDRVAHAMAMLDAGLAVRAFIHITGDGFLNLSRVEAPVGFVVDRLLPVPPIFGLIQRLGGLPDAEMFRVYNMGVGFCVVVAPSDADRVVDIARQHGKTAAVVGYAVAVEDPGRVEAILRGADLQFCSRAGVLQVAPTDAFGTVIEFRAAS